MTRRRSASAEIAVATVLDRFAAQVTDLARDLRRVAGSSGTDLPFLPVPEQELVSAVSQHAPTTILDAPHRARRAFGPGKLVLQQRTPTSQRIWTLKYTDAAGKRRFRALSTDRRVAELKRQQLIRERDMLLLGLTSVGDQSLTLVELAERYLRDLATRATPAHVRNTRARLKQVLAGLLAKRASDLRPHMLLDYRAQRLAQGCSVRTANLLGDSTRAMLIWSAKVGLTTSNPLAQLPRLPENEATARYRRRALSEQQIAAFLRAARDDDERNARHGPRVPQLPLWRALIELGGRYSEIVGAAWSDVDLDQRVLSLRPANTKTRRERVIPLLEELVGELRALRSVHEAVLGRALTPQDPIFRTPEGSMWPRHTVNLTRILHRLLKAADIARLDAQGRRIDLHALRHCAASRFARAGIPITVAQRILGHATVQMTARTYVHHDIDDLRQAVERLPRH